MSRKLLSIVVPVFNEAENLELLHRSVASSAAGLDRDWELILVDDGSSDGSDELMRELRARDPHVRYVKLSRNFGQQTALCAGLDAARGDLIMIMDADLQDPPEMIPRFVEEIEKGYELVFGVRETRQDRFLTKLSSKIFWTTIRRLSGFDIPENLAVMRIFTRRFLTEFQRFPERQKFIEGIFMWIGLRRTTLPIPHRARHAGQSKYNLMRKLRLATTAITAFSDRPLTLTTFAGVSLSLAGLGFLTYISLRKILFDYYAQGWVSTFGIVLLAGGIQMIFLGVIGKYISRLFNEVKQRPLYIVDERSAVVVEAERESYAESTVGSSVSEPTTKQSASG